MCNMIQSTKNTFILNCYCTTSEMPISQIKDVKLHFKQSFLQASDKQQKISDNFTKAPYRK